MSRTLVGIFAVFLLWAGFAFTQTSSAPAPTYITPGQIRLPAAPPGAIIGVPPSSTIQNAQTIALGNGLSIAGGVLSVTFPTQPTQTAALPTYISGETYQLTAAHPTISLAATGAANATNVQVWRNGLLQAVGVDYTYSAGVVTFLATSVGIPQPGEIIQFAYQIPPATVSAQVAK